MEKQLYPELEKQSCHELEKQSCPSLEKKSCPGLEKQSCLGLEKKLCPGLEKQSCSDPEKQSCPCLEKKSCLELEKPEKFEKFRKNFSKTLAASLAILNLFSGNFNSAKAIDTSTDDSITTNVGDSKKKDNAANKKINVDNNKNGLSKVSAENVKDKEVKTNRRSRRKNIKLSSNQKIAAGGVLGTLSLAALWGIFKGIFGSKKENAGTPPGANIPNSAGSIGENQQIGNPPSSNKTPIVNPSNEKNTTQNILSNPNSTSPNNTNLASNNQTVANSNSLNSASPANSNSSQPGPWVGPLCDSLLEENSINMENFVKFYQQFISHRKDFPPMFSSSISPLPEAFKIFCINGVRLAVWALKELKKGDKFRIETDSYDVKKVKYKERSIMFNYGTNSQVVARAEDSPFVLKRFLDDKYELFILCQNIIGILDCRFKPHLFLEENQRSLFKYIYFEENSKFENVEIGMKFSSSTLYSLLRGMFSVLNDTNSVCYLENLESNLEKLETKNGRYDFSDYLK